MGHRAILNPQQPLVILVYYSVTESTYDLDRHRNLLSTLGISRNKGNGYGPSRRAYALVLHTLNLFCVYWQVRGGRRGGAGWVGVGDSGSGGGKYGLGRVGG